MEVNMFRSEDKLTVEVIGRLDTLTSPKLEAKLEPELEGIKEPEEPDFEYDDNI